MKREEFTEVIWVDHGMIPFGQDEDVRLYDPDVDCIPSEEL